MANGTRHLLTRWVSIRLANLITEELGESHIGSINHVPTQAHGQLLDAIELMVRSNSDMELLYLVEELEEQRVRKGDLPGLQIGSTTNGNHPTRDD